jgi:uncharacterized membrane protein YfcA
VPDLFGVQIDGRFAIICAAVFLGGFMRGFVGFGAALIIVPALSLAYGPLIAVATSAIIGIPAVLQLLPEAIRSSERAIVAPVSVAIMLATPIGTWVLITASPALMKIVISILVILMVALLARGWRLPHNVSASILAGAGAMGGFIQGVAGIGGPPVVAIALSRPGSAPQQRGNILALMTAISMSSYLPQWYFGLFTRQAILIGLLLLPIQICAIWVGKRYFSGSGERFFRKAALITLAVIGVATLIVSVRGYLNS